MTQFSYPTGSPTASRGWSRLHEFVAAHASDPSDVVIAIEIDRGLLVGEYGVGVLVVGEGDQPEG